MVRSAEYTLLRRLNSTGKFKFHRGPIQSILTGNITMPVYSPGQEGTTVSTEHQWSKIAAIHPSTVFCLSRVAIAAALAVYSTYHSQQCFSAPPRVSLGVLRPDDIYDPSSRVLGLLWVILLVVPKKTSKGSHQKVILMILMTETPQLAHFEVKASGCPSSSS